MDVVDIIVMMDTIVDMMVMMDMMVDITRGCLYTTHACREGGYLILAWWTCWWTRLGYYYVHVKSVGDGHDVLDGMPVHNTRACREGGRVN